MKKLQVFFLTNPEIPENPAPFETEGQSETQTGSVETGLEPTRPGSELVPDPTCWTLKPPGVQ